MEALDLKRNPKVGYKLKINGRWTPHLRFEGETRKGYIFKPYAARKSIGLLQTEACYFIEKPLKADIRKFVRCKSSGIWKEASLFCDRDCPTRRGSENRQPILDS